MNGLVRAALAGWATGDRAFCAITVWLTKPAPGDSMPPVLRSPRARNVLSLAAVGELIGDKLPKTPPRTAPPALVARLVLAGICGAVLGRREGAVASRAGAAVVAAAASSFAGPPARAALSSRLGSDLPGALLEDLTAYGLAAAAMRP